MAEIKINEKQLRNIIGESVKKVLKEGYPYTDEEDNAYGLNVRLHEELGKLYDAAFNIAKELSLVKKNSIVNSSNYDPKVELYEWAKKITQDAEEWNKRKF